MKRLKLKKELIWSKDSSGAMIATVDASKHLKELKEASLTRNRDRQLQKAYGISLVDYKKLLSQQKEKCAICSKHQSEFDYPLHVDHNHQTGKVRGLLCSGCNTGLGHFEKHKEEMMHYLIKGEAPKKPLLPLQCQTR